MVRRDVPTCRLHDSMHDIAARMRASPWDLCAVLDDEHVLLGLLHPSALRGAASTPAEHVLQSAPTTDELGTRLKKRDHLAVTTTDARFLGGLPRSDVERMMIDRAPFICRLPAEFHRFPPLVICRSSGTR